MKGCFVSLLCTLNWGVPIENKSSCHTSPIVVLFFDGRCNSITCTYVHIASNDLETLTCPYEIFYMSSLLNAHMNIYWHMSPFLVPLEYFENLELNLAHDAGMRWIIHRNISRFINILQQLQHEFYWLEAIHCAECMYMMDSEAELNSNFISHQPAQKYNYYFA